MFGSRNDIKIKFGKPKFVTMNSAVQCILTYRIEVPEFTSWQSKETSSDGQVSKVSAYMSFDFDNNVSVGYAICHPTDTFDKHTGRKIAQARAEVNAYRHAQMLVDKYIGGVLTMLGNAAESFYVKSEYVIKHDKDYIKEMSSK